jgi:hypothetical protein
MDAPWTLSAAQIASQLSTRIDQGLSTQEVAKRRQQHGYNELEKEPPTPLWKLVLEQFDDMLVKVRPASLPMQPPQPHAAAAAPPQPPQPPASRRQRHMATHTLRTMPPLPPAPADPAAGGHGVICVGIL